MCDVNCFRTAVANVPNENIDARPSFIKKAFALETVQNLWGTQAGFKSRGLKVFLKVEKGVLKDFLAVKTGGQKLFWKNKKWGLSQSCNNKYLFIDCWD